MLFTVDIQCGFVLDLLNDYIPVQKLKHTSCNGI